MTRKKVIYVVGAPSSTPFRSAAFRYAHPRTYPEGVDLYVFDYSKYRIELFSNWRGWGGKVPAPKGPFRGDRILRHSSNPVELYKKIASIGKSTPGSLVTLHFFTHGRPERGFIWGPRGPKGENEFKRQFRGVDISAFKAAFSKDALIKLWGCGAQDEARRLTLRYCAVKNYKTQDRNQKRLEERIRFMYARRLANLLNLTVWATPPGWGSAMDRPWNKPYIDKWDPVTGPDKNSRWWRVDLDFMRGEGSHFYIHILGAKVDPVGYVGINEQMSKAPRPPIPVVRCPKPPYIMPGLLRDYPGRTSSR